MKNRLDYIDGLKGICAIGVFSLHYYGDLCNNNLPFKAYGLFQRGWLAVELFFMLSGFLLAENNICGIYLS